MLLAHARALAEVRSYLAALADTAGTFEASLEYDRVLLQLDAIHGDDTPALHDVPRPTATSFTPARRPRSRPSAGTASTCCGPSFCSRPSRTPGTWSCRDLRRELRA